MTVVLRKRRSTEEEMLFQRRMFRNVYGRAQISWEAVQEGLNAFELERLAVFKSPAAWWRARVTLWGCTAVYYFYKALASASFCREKKVLWKNKRGRWRRLSSWRR